MSAQRSNALLSVIVVLLALICAAGAVLLWRREPAAVSEAEPLSITTSAAAETAQTAAQTTVTTVTTAAQTTVASAAETTAPAETAPPTAEELYAQYITETLIPKYGLAAEGIASPDAQTGIAAALVCDFLGKGTEDLLVIRLDALDGVCASVPVLMWYTLYEGKPVQADTFESKLPWTGYCIRCAEQTVYISGEYLDAALRPESWKRTEIAVLMQENRDMVLMDMEQGGAADAPEPAYPAEAALLLEMLPDPAAEDGRGYLLYDYTSVLDTH